MFANITIVIPGFGEMPVRAGQREIRSAISSIEGTRVAFNVSSECKCKHKTEKLLSIFIELFLSGFTLKQPHQLEYVYIVTTLMSNIKV